jgi:hypothetical protein
MKKNMKKTKSQKTSQSVYYEENERPEVVCMPPRDPQISREFHKTNRSLSNKSIQDESGKDQI